VHPVHARTQPLHRILRVLYQEKKSTEALHPEATRDFSLPVFSPAYP